MDAVALVDVGVAAAMTAAVGDGLFAVVRNRDIRWRCVPPVRGVDTRLCEVRTDSPVSHP